MFNGRSGESLSGTTLFFIMLVVVDIAFVLIHAGLYLASKYYAVPDYTLFFINSDVGYPEKFQHIKIFWVVLLFAYISIKSGCYRYLSWFLLFFYFFIDDALGFHEHVGGIVAVMLSFTPPFNLSTQDVGEFFVSACAGFVLFSILGNSYWRGGELFRKVSNDLLVLVAALVFCGVVVDMIHSASEMGEMVRGALTIIEDGGEMVIVSAILSYVYALALGKGQLDIYFHEKLIFPFLAQTRKYLQ